MTLRVRPRVKTNRKPYSVPSVISRALCFFLFFFFSDGSSTSNINTREKEYCRISFYRHHYQYDKPQSLQRPTLYHSYYGTLQTCSL